MANYLGFIDETGVLNFDASQRFFALGLLMVEDASALNDQLRRVKNRAVSKLDLLRNQKGLPKREKDFEFKFSSITKSVADYYYELVDLYFKFANFKFCSLVIDKQNPKLKIEEYFPDTWSAYISFSKLLIRNNVGRDDKICVIADYLGKPVASEKFYENEVNQLGIVYNSCMMESHASLIIQVVDVLLGCVVFDFWKVRIPGSRKDALKESLVSLVRKKLGKEHLAQNFTTKEPNYFSIWEFNPK